jgi:putative hydrolase of the HAD superfamily
MAVVTVALVSNATTRLEQDLARHELSTLAHVVVSSAQIGVAKPDPSFSIIAAERVAACVERCLFIDDTPANVAAARGLGMIAVQYQRPEDLRAALAPWFRLWDLDARPPSGRPTVPTLD